MRGYLQVKLLFERDAVKLDADENYINAPAI